MKDDFRRRRFSVSAIVFFFVCCVAEGRVLHVSFREMSGVDSFRTISEATAQAEAGDTVLIHAGVYREKAVIERSGRADAPIRIEAAIGADVVMTGADRITEWEGGGEGGIASTGWPYRFIPWNRSGTHPSDDFHLLIGRCEQVFVNGFAMRQVLRRAELSRGTFYVDLEGKRLYVCGADGRDISSRKFFVEASVRDRILSVKGDYVAVKGIRFRYAANRAQQGAVELSGNHLTVADCVFEYANSSGAEFTGEDITVRGCTFAYNGQIGFGANRAHRLLVSGCTVRKNNIKGFDRGWEAGGNKICMTRGAVLERSTFIENHGNGVWFDIGNEACTVRNCLIGFNDDAGIFYEISYGLHAHDNVILNNGLAETDGSWGAGAGVSISSSPECLIERNILAGNREGFNFREQDRSTPRIDVGKSEAVWNRDSTVRQNIIAYNRDAQTWGWFDIGDERHWPAKFGEGCEGLSLEKLALKFQENCYFAAGGEGLFNWGVTWKKHKRYSTPGQVRSELGLEDGSIISAPKFRDYWGLDLSLPAGSEAVEMGCYPRGAVPGVRLGVWGP
ncbi:MAG: right-handed parallel beta-helix repeat-containing protein [Sedimentisphaerales bacterium]|nr:right-handed parallel beta-helix repeat-containing protein [Sedimentisphaerales bacterium]